MTTNSYHLSPSHLLFSSSYINLLPPLPCITLAAGMGSTDTGAEVDDTKATATTTANDLMASDDDQLEDGYASGRRWHDEYCVG